jgi:hypothetical protein
MSGAVWPWSLPLMLITAALAGLLAWHQATRLDRQAEGESWPRQTEQHGAMGLALAALVMAVAAAMLLQMMLLPRFVQ